MADMVVLCMEDILLVVKWLVFLSLSCEDLVVKGLLLL
jgi:hypothetical protein